MSMFRSTVPLRVFMIPAVLVAIGLVWEYAPSQPSPPSARIDPLPAASPDPIVPPPVPPAFSRPQVTTIDIVPELQAIGRREMKTIAPPGDGLLLAIAPCVRPTAKERAALNKRV